MIITLGALEPPLIEQLEGLVAIDKLRALDMHARAITNLHVHGFISDRESDRARRRLLKMINQALAATVARNGADGRVNDGRVR